MPSAERPRKTRAAARHLIRCSLLLYRCGCKHRPSFPALPPWRIGLTSNSIRQTMSPPMKHPAHTQALGPPTTNISCTSRAAVRPMARKHGGASAVSSSQSCASSLKRVLHRYIKHRRHSLQRTSTHLHPPPPVQFQLRLERSWTEVPSKRSCNYQACSEAWK